MTYIALNIDVTSALPDEITGGKTMAIAGWIFLPADIEATRPPPVVTLLNGGTYDKRYFHCQIPGHADYSVAEQLAARGYVVVLLDHLGIGESSRPANAKLLTRHVAAAAAHAAISEIYRRLEAGAITDDVPPISGFARIGGGHSLGGMQTITQQAWHRTYDRIMVIGYTAFGVHFSVGNALVSADPGPIDYDQADYVLADRAFLREGFHWEDVPDDVVAYDDSLLVEVPYVLATQSISTGIVIADAGKIDVPIFICLGERDVSPDPYAEPGFYRRSKDVTLYILPKSAHCQSFASTRTDLIERIDAWIRNCPERPAAIAA